MNEDVVLVDRQNRLGIMTLNRPKLFNCLSMATHQALNKALDDFEADNNIRCVLIKASGKHFCTGADLQEVSSFRGEPIAIRNFLKTGLDTFRRLENSALPIVVAQQGLALAGGLELLMSADIVFSGEGAQLGDQHAQFGLVPGWGGSQRLTRLIGRRRAMDLFFTARWISAQKALDWGLVNYVVPDQELTQAALDYCEALTRKSSSGLSTMKQLVNRGLELDLDAGLDLELDLAGPALASDDVKEGTKAFLEKREPNFK
jgi:enoyl-CoA hydratase/carnithine racemase